MSNMRFVPRRVRTGGVPWPARRGGGLSPCGQTPVVWCRMPHRKSAARRRSDRTLVIIGGREEPDGAATHEVVRRVGDGQLVIVTVATEFPAEYFEMYVRSFTKLGLREPRELSIRSRSDAKDPRVLEELDGAAAVFFTGGNQLRITSQMADTPVQHRIQEVYDAGGLVAGTSAGAAALCGTMLVHGKGFDSRRGDETRTAPGLGLLRGVVIDLAQEQEAPVGELIGVALAIVLLSLLFRSVAAMIATLVGALIGVMVGQALLVILAAPLGMPQFAATIAVMLGLGAGIDYSLLIIGRFREQSAAGDSVRDAAAKSAATSGSAVVAAVGKSVH